MILNPRLAIEIPFLSTAFSKPAGCFVNVHRQVKKHGGRAVFGWLSDTPIFAEKPLVQIWAHHCVWESPERKLYDITPTVSNVSDAFIMAHFPQKSTFIPDTEAQLVVRDDGLFQSLLPNYTAIIDNTKVHEGIAFLQAADQKLRDGDLRGESYWCQRASSALSGLITPHGDQGVRMMAPFSLD